MKNAEMEIVKFGNEDVIATSIGFTLLGFGDNKTNNATIQIGSGSRYSIEGEGGWKNEDQFYDKIAKDLFKLGYEITGEEAKKLQFYINNNDGPYSLHAALGWDNPNKTDSSDRSVTSWNGYYLYNPNNQHFEQVRRFN